MTEPRDGTDDSQQHPVTDTGKITTPVTPQPQPETPIAETSSASSEASPSSVSKQTPSALESSPISKISSVLENLTQQITRMGTALQEFTYKDKIIKELHEELQIYKNGLRKELITPLLKHIMLLHSRLMDTHDYYASNASQDTDTFQQLLREYKKLPISLTDLLHDYDIEPLEPKVGESYQSKTHEVKNTVSTDDTCKDRTVMSCGRTGFVDVSNGRVLKRAEVTIFKLKSASAEKQTNSTN